MGHFADTFRVKINAETCQVRLSVRSDDKRVDEHLLDIRDFNAATQEIAEGWCGTDLISTKRIGNEVLVSIRESGIKRILYRVSYNHWRIVCEEFLRELRVSGVEIRPAVVQEKPAPIRVPVEEIVQAVASSILPAVSGQMNLILKEIKDFKATKLVQVTEVKQATGDEAIFIPSNLMSSNISGDAKITSVESEGDQLDDALAALKKLKKDRSKK